MAGNLMLCSMLRSSEPASLNSVDDEGDKSKRGINFLKKKKKERDLVSDSTN